MTLSKDRMKEYQAKRRAAQKAETMPVVDTEWSLDPRTTTLQAELEASQAEVAMLKRRLAEKPAVNIGLQEAAEICRPTAPVGPGLMSQSKVAQALPTMSEMKAINREKLLKRTLGTD